MKVIYQGGEWMTVAFMYIAGLKLDNVDDMGQWLDVDLLDAEGEEGHPPDLFVVGFQEVGGMSETPFI